MSDRPEDDVARGQEDVYAPLSSLPPPTRRNTLIGIAPAPNGERDSSSMPIALPVPDETERTPKRPSAAQRRARRQAREREKAASRAAKQQRAKESQRKSQPRDVAEATKTREPKREAKRVPDDEQDDPDIEPVGLVPVRVGTRVVREEAKAAKLDRQTLYMLGAAAVVVALVIVAMALH
jgi:hypothetical protein